MLLRCALSRLSARGLATILVCSLVLGAALLGLSRASAEAAVQDKVLILAGTVTGGASSIEAAQAQAQGMAVEIVDGATWASMSASQFSDYRALIFGDPTCAGPGTTPAIDAAATNATTWGPLVNGNIVIVGTDPVYHASQGGETLTRRGIDFALAQEGKTGAYISLSCYYHGAAPGTPVPLLEGIGAGGFAVTGVGCYNAAHIVAASPALAGLTDADLSGWSCSVHEAFQSWPAGLIPLAIARDFDSSFTASDGTQGPPYILAGGDIRSFPLSLAPLSASAAAGSTHTVTATLLDGRTSEPLAAAPIGFEIAAGPNAGASGNCVPASCLTSAAGEVSFSYQSNGALGTDTIRAFYDQNANGTADAGEPLTSAGVEWTVPLRTLKAVVLGDSFASGEGTYSYTLGEKCHRSSLAWGGWLDAFAARLEVVANLACSGARISHLVSEGFKGEQPQVEALRQLAAREQIDLVLLMIGGNDLAFAKALERCFKQNGPKPLGPLACVDDLERVDERVPAVAQKLADSVIPAVQFASGATVVLVGYPRIFPLTQAEATTCGWLSGPEQQAATNVAQAIANSWRRAASRSDALYVDSLDAFSGRELCVEDGSWFNPVLGKPFGLQPEQAHPTVEGYENWARVIRTRLLELGIAIG